MNNKYIQDFNTALDIYENDYSHENLIELLKTGSVAERQASVLKLTKLFTQYDANVLMSNLTRCDGKIREAVSFRLPEFVRQNPEFFTKYEDIFLDAIIDINGNICRNTISAISNLKNNTDFCYKFCKNLTDKTLKLATIAKTFDPQDGKYKVNKEIFKLYWCLETIYHFAEHIDTETVTEILNLSKDIKDYTIREKTAKILSKFNGNKIFEKIKEELKQDENYYVRRI